MIKWHSLGSRPQIWAPGLKLRIPDAYFLQKIFAVRSIAEREHHNGAYQPAGP